MPNQQKFPTVRILSRLCERFPFVDSPTVNRSLERYFWLLDQQELNLSEQELASISDATNGLMDDQPDLYIQSFRLKVIERAKELGGKRQIDPDALVSKISSFSDTEMMALINAIEKSWATGDAED